MSLEGGSRRRSAYREGEGDVRTEAEKAVRLFDKEEGASGQGIRWPLRVKRQGNRLSYRAPGGTSLANPLTLANEHGSSTHLCCAKPLIL